MSLQKTLDQLAALAKRVPEICVAYSGGKDSLAVMDLCVKHFASVRAFQWYCIPDLEVLEAPIRFAKERWGVEVAQIPHWDMVNAMREGLWCDAHNALEAMKPLELKTAYAFAMHTCGTEFCATGMKEADGLPRRHFFANIRDSKDDLWRRLLFPIREWNKKDVLDYLTTNGIPIPESEPGAVTTGVGLNHDALCWLHDKHPADFGKLLKWFPYAGAVIKRREWYGVQ